MHMFYQVVDIICYYVPFSVKDDCCGICRMEFEECCPACSVPGDDCPPVGISRDYLMLNSVFKVWGQCNHAFHMHCIVKWLESQQNVNQQCPMCRADWVFGGSSQDVSSDEQRENERVSDESSPVDLETES